MRVKIMRYEYDFHCINLHSLCQYSDCGYTLYISCVGVLFYRIAIHFVKDYSEEQKRRV